MRRRKAKVYNTIVVKNVDGDGTTCFQEVTMMRP